MQLSYTCLHRECFSKGGVAVLLEEKPFARLIERLSGTSSVSSTHFVGGLRGLQSCLQNIARSAGWFPPTDPQESPEGSELTPLEKKQGKLNLKGLDGLYGLWVAMSPAADKLGVWLLLTGKAAPQRRLGPSNTAGWHCLGP